MPYNFIYIDDTFGNLEKGTINGIQKGGDIQINFSLPSNTWEEQIDEIKDMLQKNVGVIIDLRLNDMPNKNGKNSQFRGSSIAQELRTLVKEKSIAEDFPIILLSANNKIEESLDKTSYDLFDYVINKSFIEQDKGVSYNEFKSLLITLAEGYDFLNHNDDAIDSILQTRVDILDQRFLDEFHSLKGYSKHIIARFILRQVLEKPSFLIDRNFVLARLGIDPTSKDVDKLFDFLQQFMYTGIFSSYYKRWWMPLILEWWDEISPDESLRGLSAEKRVEIIRKSTTLDNLIPIERDKRSVSTSFWTICKGTGIPIDTIDGFLIAGQENQRPWQEKEYVSIQEALRPQNLDYWFGVSALEKNRLQKLKDAYGQTEQRVRR